MSHDDAVVKLRRAVREAIRQKADETGDTIQYRIHSAMDLMQRTLADNIAQLAWMADASGAIFWCNHRWLDFTGTTLEETRGFGWQKVHHPDHVARVISKLVRCYGTGEPCEKALRVARNLAANKARAAKRTRKEAA